jgi:predicted ArsR family transcriptional regulator
MGDHQLRVMRVLACESRMQILQLLQERQRALPVDEVAAAVGLHVNTTREHLDRLVASGFVERSTEHRTTRGRPRMLYRSIDSAAVAAIDSKARAHLVSLLLEGYGQPMESPVTAAEMAGVAWAAELGCPGSEATGDPERDYAAQVDALVRHLEELGFEPERLDDDEVLALHHCPFADISSDRRGVICGAHLGLVRGILERHQGPLKVEALAPRGEGTACTLRLRREEAVAEAGSELVDA